MSIEKVRKYFKQFGIENKIMEFNVSSATVELAAKALNCEAKRIAKTLSFLIDGKPILIVTAGDTKIDNMKYKTQFHSKAKMIPYEDVEKMTGYKAGGVCPFAVNEGIDVFLDNSLKRFNSVFPACGSANSTIELTMEELEKYSRPKQWIDVCKIQ